MTTLKSPNEQSRPQSSHATPGVKKVDICAGVQGNDFASLGEMRKLYFKSPPHTHTHTSFLPQDLSVRRLSTTMKGTRHLRNMSCISNLMPSAVKAMRLLALAELNPKSHWKA